MLHVTGFLGKAREGTALKSKLVPGGDSPCDGGTDTYLGPQGRFWPREDAALPGFGAQGSLPEPPHLTVSSGSPLDSASVLEGLPAGVEWHMQQGSFFSSHFMSFSKCTWCFN